MGRWGCVAGRADAAAGAHRWSRDGDDIRAIATGRKNPLPAIGGHDGTADDIGTPR
jgi:hypothetical protein